MQIGMMNNPRIELLAEIAWARQHDFDYLDLTLEPIKTHPKQIKIKKVLEALKNANLPIIGHTAYYLPIASPLESLRQAAWKEMEWALEIFSNLGASKVTVHPDRSIPFALGPNGVQQNNLESLEEINRIAQSRGIQILLENMDRTFNTTRQIEDVLRRFPGMGFHLDVGHANLNVDRNRTEEFVQHFRDRLAHVHFSDNFGKSDDLHLPLGAGAIDWRHIISLLKNHGYDGTITLEIFSSERRYLLFSRDKVKEIWQGNLEPGKRG